MKKVAIIGSGISGLTCAYKIKKKSKEINLPIEITLIEKEKRLGGVFLTEKINGFLIEGGPDCFESEKPHTLALAEELDIGEQVIGGNEEAHLTFVFLNGKLWQLPKGLLSLAPTRLSDLIFCPFLSWRGKIRAGFDLILPPWKEERDISLAEFYKRRFGKEIFDCLAEPLFGSIYACIPENISLKSCWPRGLQLEKEYGSLIRGMLVRRKMRKRASTHGQGVSTPGQEQKKLPIFLTFKNGMRELTDTLVKHLSEVSFLTRKKAISLKFNSQEKRCILLLDDGTSITADTCILATTPSYATAEILKSVDTGLSDILMRIPYVSSATISLAYKKEGFPHPLKGFGVLVSRQEKKQVKAITWSSTKFSNRALEGYVLIRAFIGGAEDETKVYENDEEILKIVKEDLRQIMGINVEPVLTKIYRWPNSMPQYTLGHEKKVRFIEERIKQYPGLYLTSNAYRGIGISDCIYNATQTAEQVIKLLRETS
ncbi:MAG: protoporphyrinogen oxidase [Actinomycetota bacterium]